MCVCVGVLWVWMSCSWPVHTYIQVCGCSCVLHVSGVPVHVAPRGCVHVPGLYLPPVKQHHLSTLHPQAGPQVPECLSMLGPMAAHSRAPCPQKAGGLVSDAEDVSPGMGFIAFTLAQLACLY